MIGTWRWNAAFGGFGAALVLLFSLGSNPLLTSITRSFYAFVAFALLAFGVRFVLGLVLAPQPQPLSPESAESEEETGTNLDLVTPDEEEVLSQMLKENWSDNQNHNEADTSFKPLSPTKLVSIDDPDPKEVAQAIRRLTEER